jgi:hypothetical protein
MRLCDLPCGALGLAVIVLAAAGHPATSHQAEATSSLPVAGANVTGDAVFVYNFLKEHCPVLPQPWCALDIDIGCDCDIADAPVRAWFNGSQVNMLSSVDLGSRGLVGPTAGDVVHSCRVYGVWRACCRVWRGTACPHFCLPNPSPCGR